MASNQREDILIQAFLSYPTITEIAEKTGISRSTVYKYIHRVGAFIKSGDVHETKQGRSTWQ